MTRKILPLICLAVGSPLAHAAAQDASFIYRLGKDTVAMEHYTRTPTRLTGDVVTRQGVAVVRTQYDAQLRDGHVTSMTYLLFGPDGKPIAGRPREVRFEMIGDSAKRTVVWADSTQTRTLAAISAVPFVASAYSLLELAVANMRRNNMTTASLPALSAAFGQALPSIALSAAGGDTIRQPSGLVFVFDRNNLLQSVDGLSTTGKIVGTRSNTPLNIAAMTNGMKPTGVLSSRGTARAAFATPQPGAVVIVDYGRPLVRDRTIWGGLLIPLDTIWRLGANEATHFASGRDLDFNGVLVPSGLYTLFLYNAKSGPMLVVNRQTGQWGTAYDQAKDLVRIPLTMAASPEFLEEFTVNVRPIAPNRGALEFGWGAQVASATFTVKP